MKIRRYLVSFGFIKNCEKKTKYIPMMRHKNYCDCHLVKEKKIVTFFDNMIFSNINFRTTDFFRVSKVQQLIIIQK